MILISACLLGVCCRFDGKNSAHKDIQILHTQEVLIPVCPEQLGGLPTPRSPAEIKKGNGMDVLLKRARVINAEGLDVSTQFITGAEQALFIVRALGVDRAILKERSPSCGTHYIKRGGRTIEGVGVAAALLKKHGIQIISSEEVN